MEHQPSFDDDSISGYRRSADRVRAEGGDWAPEDPDLSAGDLVAVASELVESQLRSRPIPTLLAALAAGWLVGRILR